MNKEEFLLSIPDSISLTEALSDVAMIFTKASTRDQKKPQGDLEKYICFHKELKWGVYKHEDKYFLVNIWHPKKFLGIENPSTLLKVTEVLTDADDDSYLEKASIKGNNLLTKTSDSEKLFLETITEYDSKQDALKAEELVKQIKAKRKAEEEERGRVERKEEEKSTAEGIQQMKYSKDITEISQKALGEERKAENAAEVEAKKLEEFTEAVEEFTEAIEEFTESIEGIEDDLEDLEDQGNQFAGKYYSQADLAEIEKIHPKYSELLSLFESLKESIEGIEDDLEGLEEQIEEVADAAEIAILQKELQDLQSLFESLKESANNIKDDIKDLEDQIEKIAVAVEEVEEVEEPRAAGEMEYKAKYMKRENYSGFTGGLKPELLEKELNVLGNQGWEMVGVAYADGIHNRVIIFKK